MIHPPTNSFAMKKLIILLYCLSGISGLAVGQDLILNTINGRSAKVSNLPPNAVAQLIDAQKRQKAVFQELNLFGLSAEKRQDSFIPDAIYLNLNQAKLARFFENPAKNINVNIPIVVGKLVQLELTQVKITSNNFSVTTASGKNTLYQPSGIFYRGIVKGDNHSTVTMGVFDGHVKILIIHATGTFVLDDLKEEKATYLLVNEKKLPVKQDNWVCHTLDQTASRTDLLEKKNTSKTYRDEDRCVKVYVETEYQVYLDYDESLINVVDYVFGIFNDVIAVYADIEVKMEISQIFVWDEDDPYSGLEDTTNTDEVLKKFVANRPSFNGNLAHLLTTRGIGGGKANTIGGVCDNSIDSSPHCVSGSLEVQKYSYEFPTTALALVRVAHEMGHVLGSPHTHACAWNGNDTQIDDCGNFSAIINGEDDNEDGEIDNLADAEGKDCFDTLNLILPANGKGTIMSYCHQIDTIERDLLNGFGDQPANKIRERVMSSDCLIQQCNCEEFTDRTVTGAPIPSAVYTASNSITSSGDANGSRSIVIFQAGNRIELTSGFEGTELFVAQVITTLCDGNEDNTLQPIEGAELDKKPLGIPAKTSELKVYPNPAFSDVQLEYYLPKAQKISMVIYNQYGQVVQVIEPGAVHHQGQHTMPVLLTKFTSGLYYAVLQTPGERLVKPFVVSRL